MPHPIHLTEKDCQDMADKFPSAFKWMWQRARQNELNGLLTEDRPTAEQQARIRELLKLFPNHDTTRNLFAA